ncbi:MAG: pilin [Lachnospiraceae bacterium]|nr:pilin [Lachnospiraceae bacterium]
MKNTLIKLTNYLSKHKNVAIALKALAIAFVAGSAAIAAGAPAQAASDFTAVVKPIVGLMNKFVNPLLLLVGAGGTIYSIMLGVKYATAEEPQEREKRKQALKTAIIGFVLIFVLIVALKLSIEPLTNWMNESVAGANGTMHLNE